MLIIGDSLDSAVCAHFRPNDSFDRPRRRECRRTIAGSPSTSPSASRHVTRMRE